MTRTEVDVPFSPTLYFLFIMESAGASIDWDNSWPSMAPASMAPAPEPDVVSEVVDLDSLMGPLGDLDNDFWVSPLTWTKS